MAAASGPLSCGWACLNPGVPTVTVLRGEGRKGKTMNLEALWAQFLTTYGPLLLGLVVLVVVDVLTGIASALKRHTLDFKLLGNFLATSVLPLVLGWVALSIFAFAVANVPGLPPAIASLIGPSVADSAYALVVLELGASVLQNVGELGLLPAQPAAPAAPPAPKA